LAAQGFLAAHGLFAAQGFFALQGFFAAQGLRRAAQGLAGAHRFARERARAPHGLQGLAAGASGAPSASETTPAETSERNTGFNS
jgi:hypothetical protein